jgi:hypothetical protein
MTAVEMLLRARSGAKGNANFVSGIIVSGIILDVISTNMPILLSGLGR